ncbi:MAG: PaREP1 family protein [Chloroflexota bacterium]|nr:PaREP1 family protein [Chloroflexota bacterium]MDE2941780.1 PaREP1 family protein [Chloroflexota bacterium]MDE3266844.1 PaREP1 family protein [Chloroflexota bacterium]
MVTQLTYRQQSRTFLEQTNRELQAGDLRQASEKGWGAAAQIVKAAAEARGWEHDHHRLLFEVVSRLSRDVSDDEISSLFWAANALHTNFYEGGMDEVTVRAALQHVERLVEKVEALLPQT